MNNLPAFELPSSPWPPGFFAYRSRIVADLILPHTTVCDIGCGECDLLDALGVDALRIDYRAFDLYPSRPIVEQIDLNSIGIDDALEWLPKCDYAVMCGVLEYLDRPFDIVQAIAKRAKAEILIVSGFFVSNQVGPWHKDQWPGCQIFKNELLLAGWSSAARLSVANRQAVWVCKRRGDQ